jgi:hypothetical protein
LAPKPFVAPRSLNRSARRVENNRSLHTPQVCLCSLIPLLDPSVIVVRHEKSVTDGIINGQTPRAAQFFLNPQALQSRNLRQFYKPSSIKL